MVIRNRFMLLVTSFDANTTLQVQAKWARRGWLSPGNSSFGCHPKLHEYAHLPLSAKSRSLPLRMRRRHLGHETPFWIRGEPDYFITICTRPKGRNQLCLPTVGAQIIQTVAGYHQRKRWFCHLAVLMPDHVHFLLSFPPELPNFARVVGEWKKWVVKSCHISWQENFFDHRIRNADNDRYKSDYIWQNPARAGLIKNADDWPYKWLPDSP
jgi:putative transposase